MICSGTLLNSSVSASTPFGVRARLVGVRGRAPVPGRGAAPADREVRRVAVAHGQPPAQRGERRRRGAGVAGVAAPRFRSDNRSAVRRKQSIIGLRKKGRSSVWRKQSIIGLAETFLHRFSQNF